MGWLARGPKPCQLVDLKSHRPPTIPNIFNKKDGTIKPITYLSAVVMVGALNSVGTLWAVAPMFRDRWMETWHVDVAAGEKFASYQFMSTKACRKENEFLLTSLCFLS